MRLFQHFCITQGSDIIRHFISSTFPKGLQALLRQENKASCYIVRACQNHLCFYYQLKYTPVRKRDDEGLFKQKEMLGLSVICGGSTGMLCFSFKAHLPQRALEPFRNFLLSQGPHPQIRYIVSTVLQGSLSRGAVHSSGFLAVSHFLLVPGDFLLSLQTPLKFPLEDRASPDLSGEN